MNDDEQLSDPPRLASDPGASDALRALAADARELAPPALPAEVRARVRKRLAQETERSSPVPWAWAAATLALAAVALLAWLWPGAATPTAPALPTLIAEPADAALDGGFDAGPLDPPEPRELVPFVEVSGNGCGLDVRVSLTEIDDDVRSVALVMDEHAAEGDGSVSVDCEGTVVHELDGALFRAAQSSHASLAVPFTLLPPATRCGGRYSITVCVRDALGRLATRADAVAYPTRTDELDDGRPVGRFETPSGRTALSDLARGHVVTGFFFQTSPPWTTPGGHWPTFVEASVLRVLREADVPAGVVTLRLEDGHVAHVAHGQGVWVLEAGYRPAEELTAGMRVLSLDGVEAPLLGALAQSAPRAVTITEVRLEPDARLDGGLDVTFPDALFLDGILVHDLGPDSRHTGPLATFTPSREPVRALPEPSWDCSLATELVIDAIPEDARSIAIVYAPHRGRGGARMPLGCDGGTVGAELPMALLASVPPTRGETRVLAAEISGWDDENDDWHPIPERESEDVRAPTRADVRCSTEYAVLACVRGADGALRSLDGASGRWALTGPACFARGTLIDTPDGPRPIESLRPGEHVLTREPRSREVRPVRVRALLPRGQRPVLELVLGSGETLRVTAEHPLYDPQSESFRLAGSFAAGEHLLSAEGERVPILEVRARTLSAPVYDLSVEAPHTYLAGGILAHNY